MTSPQYISEATTATFEQEVLERSRHTPVLVDFWAPWCAPCKTLGPVLEQAVAARAGAVWLVKVNTDDNQDLAASFEIRGIPAVKAFVNGQLADEFTGALGKAAVEAFIDRVCPSSEEAALDRAVALLDEEKPAQVEAVLQPALADPHFRDLGLLVLARARAALGQIEQALAALQEIDEQSTVSREAEQLRVFLQMAGAAGGLSQDDFRERLEADPADHDARWALAGMLQGAGEVEAALDQLLEIVMRDRKYRDDGARKAILAILDGLGPDSDLAREVRGRLQIYL